MGNQILDKFYQNIYCYQCKSMTEHIFQKILEYGESDYGYAECLVCKEMQEVEMPRYGLTYRDCLACGQSMATKEGKLVCAEHDYVEVAGNGICNSFN